MFKSVFAVISVHIITKVFFSFILINIIFPFEVSEMITSGHLDSGDHNTLLHRQPEAVWSAPFLNNSRRLKDVLGRVGV